MAAPMKPVTQPACLSFRCFEPRVDGKPHCAKCDTKNQEHIRRNARLRR